MIPVKIAALLLIGIMLIWGIIKTVAYLCGLSVIIKVMFIFLAVFCGLFLIIRLFDNGKGRY